MRVCVLASPGQRPGFLFAADANARDVKSSARVGKPVILQFSGCGIDQ